MVFLIDTDCGADDTMCIHQMINNYGPDIVGITVVGGNINRHNGFGVMKTLLRKVFRRPDIPVSYGPQDPPNTSSEYYAADGHFGMLPHETEDETLHPSSVDTIVNLLNERDDVSILALGPLTNLHLAEVQSPGVLGKAKQILIMGGTLRDPGNVTPRHEFNFYMDGPSVKTVLTNPNVVLFPLDLTTRFCFERQRMGEALAPSPWLQSLVQKFPIEPRQQSTDVWIHDAVVSSFLVCPSLFRIETEHCAVTETGEINVGGSVSVKCATFVSPPNDVIYCSWAYRV